MNKLLPAIIVGSGPAGYTAAIYLCRAGYKPVLIEGKEPGGQLMGTSLVENWPGETSILGPELMLKIRKHAAHFGTEFIFDQVTSVDFTKSLSVITANNKIFQAASIIIASGANPKKLNCPGEDTYWGRGVSTCATCDAIFYKNKKVVVVGGGDSAMEIASFLYAFTQEITIVHILDKLTASYSLQQRVIDKPGINIIYNSTVSAIEGDGTRVTRVTIKNLVTNNKSSINTDGVFIAIGLKPNTDPFKDAVALAKDGTIIVKNHSETSVNGVFAAGNIIDVKYRQAITAAGSGCMAALDAIHYLKEIKYSET